MKNNGDVITPGMKEISTQNLGKTLFRFCILYFIP